MKAFLTVARGSDCEPQLIVMRYHGDKNSDSSMGIIGKGLCYDSGGLFLKPGASMEHSKADMAGGAAVIGAMCTIAANNLPVNVTAVVAACENMLDGNGYRNGDIVHTMAGKSVFVGSTDAEGRLTLADAITYMVRHENVDSIIELSTLTGSCANFFGDVCCGVLTTDDLLYAKLLSVSEISGEKYWRIPHFDEFREFIKSDIADLHNTSTGGAGGICAGLFLDEFKEDKPLIHLDVAGMTFTKKKRDGYPKGGTGYGVKTIYEYIKA
jgi:leucyl aminopeptidase